MTMIKQSKKGMRFLVPGLAIKRWLFLAGVGTFLILLGMALLFNMQPVTWTIKTLQALALVVPSYISGSVVIIFGVLFCYWGANRTSKTVLKATGCSDGSSLVDELYRHRQLSNGPKVVAIGGGTGLSTLLRGLKAHTNNITAIVTVGDDGGSSGRLRKEQGIIPPGDIRNCLAALADEEQLMTELFQYRFKNGHGLEGHSFGNLFLTAMCRVTGDMLSAIKASSNVLNISGRVLPSTLESIALSAEMEDGTVVHGESNIPEASGRIVKLRSTPSDAQPLPDAMQAIAEADLIIMGPGSLFTSVIPNLLIDNLAKALSMRKVPKVYIANIMSQQGETDGFTVSDHVQAIMDHAPFDNLVNAVFVNDNVPPEMKKRYEKSGSHPIEIDVPVCRALGVDVVSGSFVDTEQQGARHNPYRVAQRIMTWYRTEWLVKQFLSGSPKRATVTLPGELPVPYGQTLSSTVPSARPEAPVVTPLS